MEFRKIEEKWQKRWEKSGIFQVKEDHKKKKYFVLEMLPYPTATGLHMGHVRNYSMGDAVARFKRMQGFNVLYPMGYDAFGLPAENAAIKHKAHPRDFTEKAIKAIKRDQKRLGNSYDWSREISSCNPDYYRWNQWLFLRFFNKGLVYPGTATINWCPKCESVLANEEVGTGVCWRCGSAVEAKQMSHWFLKITECADELLKNLETLENWPENVRTMQENWIGRKEWIDVDYEVEGTGRKVTVSTTRPDTNFGATFIVIAPEHSLLSKGKGLVPEKYRKAVDEYIEYAKKKTELERISEVGKKTGAFTGLYCINQLTNKKMPIWVTDFVLMSVGTGIVVGVPGHDMRDFEFAKEFNLPIVRVVVGSDGDKSEITRKEQVQEEEGIMINSGFLNGLDIHAATKKMMDYLEEKAWGRRTIRYRLRDWLISRERYWGTPIPIIHCDKCGVVPVPEDELPVLLPEKVEFTGKGNPLDRVKDFVETTCPRCRGKARRETRTMSGWMDSSWYFFRYTDPKNSKMPFDIKKADYWMPVDQYIGGVEHAIMHLMYARFFTMVLRDIGLTKLAEPFARLFTQGMVYKDGHKMSKSKGNVVSLDSISKRYGADTARVFLLFLAAPEKELEWSDVGITGSFKFMWRVHSMFSGFRGKGRKSMETSDKRIVSKMHKTIQKVSECMEGFRFNTAITAIMGFTNALQGYRENPNKEVFRECLETLATLISPFAPHLAEECWELLGNKPFISLCAWPEAKKELIDEKLDLMESLVEQTETDVKEILKLIGKKPGKIKVFVSPLWKYTVHGKILASSKDSRELVKEAMADPGLRKQGKSLVQFVEKLSRETGRLGRILTQGEECQALDEARKDLEKGFGCSVEIIREEESDSPRAKKAEPGKPGIEVV